MAKAMSRIGSSVREMGQALERLGYDMGWVYVGFERYREPLNRSQILMPVDGHLPVVAPDAFVAPSANVSGNVSLGTGASIFYNCVVRGDAASVSIGKGSNVQDGSTIATARTGVSQFELPVVIGENVTIGHAATLRSCQIDDLALIGMGACVLEGARVEHSAMVAAGAVVLPGTVVPSGQLWGGNPARFLRDLKPEESAFLPTSASMYVQTAASHKEVCDAAAAALP